MPAALRDILLVILLGLAALGSWWMAENYESPAAPETKMRHTPDYSMQNATLATMNARGRTKRVLDTPLLVHFMDDDSIEATSPHIVFHGDPGEMPWLIDGEQGFVSGDGKTIRLLGKVTMNQAASGTQPATRITTRDVTWRPDDDYVETDAPLRVDHGNDWQESTGMRATLSPYLHLYLLADVRSYYAPVR